MKRQGQRILLERRTGSIWSGRYDVESLANYNLLSACKWGWGCYSTLPIMQMLQPIADWDDQLDQVPIDHLHTIICKRQGLGLKITVPLEDFLFYENVTWKRSYILYPLTCGFSDVSLSGGAWPDHPLHHETTSDHRHDGVLPGSPQRERSQWFPAGVWPTLYVCLCVCICEVVWLWDFTSWHLNAPQGPPHIATGLRKKTFAWRYVN